MLILGHRKPSFPCQSCDKKFPDPKAADQHMMAKRHYALTSLSISPTNSSDRHSVSRPSSPEPKGHDINKAGFTYRVRGVPLDWDRNDLEGFLAETGQITMPTVLSLFEEVNRKWQTATITCAEPPPNSLRQLEPLTIDSEFYGFTTLYAPSKEDHQIDVITIPGLGGHAFGSFKERGGKHMWLRDSLGVDLQSNGERCGIGRVMIYGYESGLERSDSFQSLEDLANALRLKLNSLDMEKPIIFIAHSLGGLIVKEMIILLSRSDSMNDRGLQKLVKGLAFLGVPNGGMDIQSLIPMVTGSPNRSLVDSLNQMYSPLLTRQHEDFRRVSGREADTIITCFYETRLSPTAQKDSKGMWTMNGEKKVLVTQASATQVLRYWEDNRNHKCAVNRTHSELVKFTFRDDDYDLVLGRLKSLADGVLAAHK
jgi:hypothetical protein